MSAPSANPISLILRRGAELPVAQPVPVLPVVPRRPVGEAPGPGERRSPDPVAMLSRRLDELCTRAVDPWEIAAGLEADGLTDERARSGYRSGDVFALAANMFRMVPRRTPEANATGNPWREEPLRHLAHAATFALPGVLYAAAAPATPAGTPGHDGPLLAVSLVLGWSLSQALGYAGHVGVGWGHGRAAEATLRRALLALCFLAVPAGLLLDLLPQVSTRAAGLAVALPLYMVAAAALLVIGQDAILTGLLAAAAVGVVVTGQAGPDAAPVMVSLGALVLVCATALVRLWPSGGSSMLRLTRPQLRQTGHQALWGALAAGLLLVVLHQFHGAGTPVTLVLLAVWMGPAEWVVHRLRRLGWEELHRSRSLAGFRQELGRLATRLGLLWTGTFVATALLPAIWNRDVATAAAVLPFALIGLGFLAALISGSLGRTAAAVTVTSGCIALTAGLLAISYPIRTYLPTAALHQWPVLLLAVSFAAGQVALATRTVGRPALHH